MARQVVIKVNAKLKFLHQKNKYLTPNLRLSPYNVLMQPYFDYACSAWYCNLCKKLKNKIQTSQNKCIRFYLQFHKIAHAFPKEFETIDCQLKNYLSNV